MKLIVITRPDIFSGEAEAVTTLFRNGLQTLHLRKPQAKEQEVEEWIHNIPLSYHSRIVLHDHFRLAGVFQLQGIHLNSRHPQKPVGYHGQTSRSCHTLEEVERYKQECDYVFLSPIYNSISKPGYDSAFSHEDLCQARDCQLIDDRVIALGGIDHTRIEEIRSLGFGGVAVLGDVWKQSSESFLPHFHRLWRQTHGAPPTVLTIAGSDSSGGAGIQADIKTISALGAYAASALTALTAQTTQGVQGISPVDPEFMVLQVSSVLNDLQVDAIKIGMVGDSAMTLALSHVLQRYTGPIVYDPVMISTSGHRLMEENAIEAVCRYLLPQCTLITPNLHEARLLASRPINTIEDMEQAALYLSECYHTAILIKGGHLEGHSMCDILSCHGKVTRFTAPKVESRNLHGTGCTLSSAIATYLAMGNVMEEAIKCAKAYVSQAIIEARNLHIGQGQGPLWHGSFI